MTDTGVPNIILVDFNYELIDTWQRAFRGTPVQVQQGTILNVDADAIVSPANSFGYMDGGIDLVYSQHFGWDVERAVRKVLLNEWEGEMPVGNAFVVPIENPENDPKIKVKWLISAPTMRVPSKIGDTVNAFLAFKAILRAVRDHNAKAPETSKINTVLCPGLGTGEGRMPPDRCARQMRRAWDVVINGMIVREGGLAGAVRDHMGLLE